MINVTFNDFINLVKSYNAEEVAKVTKAYNLASYLHDGQLRQSGESYIIHPLNVAYILAEMHADGDTLCAGLLHDTLEDTKATKEDIAHAFNESVACLVDGVTKLSKMNFSSKKEEESANTRKIITGITTDVRIIIIKLADRLHNMRTLEYKSKFKQKENAIETMEIFAPLAYCIGEYRIKNELEDLSFKYLKPDYYKRINDKVDKLSYENELVLKEMLTKISLILNSDNIPNELKLRTKNIYGIYKKMNEGHKISEIHDLYSIKVIVDSIASCYLSLGRIHSVYRPINEMFKDYICNPKTNMYRSLHTTVFGPNNILVQNQIRTRKMDRVASFGLTAWWDISKGKARIKMQEVLKEKYQFFNSIIELNKMFFDNDDFVNQAKSELFSDKVYVYTHSGDHIELPSGSTIIDFAFSKQVSLGDRLLGATINGKKVPLNYVLQSKDRVVIIESKRKIKIKKEWLDMAETSYAKKQISEMLDSSKLLLKK